MTQDLLVPQQPVDQEYGVLIYDVPTQHNALYQKLLRKVQSRAIRLNMSVYLFLWGMKGELEALVEEAKAECPGQTAVISVFKFDNSSGEDLRTAARDSLIREVSDIAKRLRETVQRNVAEAEEKGEEWKHISEHYARKIERRLQEANGLAVIFGLTREVSHAMETAKQLFSCEMTKIMSERQLRKAQRKATTTMRNISHI